MDSNLLQKISDLRHVDFVYSLLPAFSGNRSICRTVRKGRRDVFYIKEAVPPT